MRLGVDPWPGSGGNHLLAPHVCDFLGLKGFHYVCQIVDPVSTTIWRQGWINGVALGLHERDYAEWNRYKHALGEAHIHIQERPYELLWDGNPSG